MAYCGNCGSEIADGVKFCTECGAPIEIRAALSRNNEISSEKKEIPNESVKNKMGRKVKREESGFEKFSKFFGIILLFIAIVDYNSDPPILTIILSLAIIVGAIFCLSQKYKLKVFTIIALLLALFCFFAGISQGKELGFLNIPKDEDYAKAYSESKEVNDTPSITSESDKKEDEQTVVEASEEETSAIVEESESQMNEQLATTDGVDPELKAFLDSYEEFMDEYIAFMKKYSEDSDNAVSMLGEYVSIMEKYGEFAEAVDKYDENEMSTEDAKYYLEATNRINQKLLDIY